ncbi:uncharacterized protein LOC131682090 [Topomyia yanbarensis]|uniref:uncharacterized protein LOC131682090 n=1 Tax=Topomyia yanbarensis TaxID=2498891 RepID=UPI00273C0507|nr:uncharacterized protein LOC131682090 [Topomyia yanbarensis]
MQSAVKSIKHTNEKSVQCKVTQQIAQIEQKIDHSSYETGDSGASTFLPNDNQLPVGRRFSFLHPHATIVIGRFVVVLVFLVIAYFVAFDGVYRPVDYILFASATLKLLIVVNVFVVIVTTVVNAIVPVHFATVVIERRIRTGGGSSFAMTMMMMQLFRYPLTS